MQHLNPSIVFPIMCHGDSNTLYYNSVVAMKTVTPYTIIFIVVATETVTHYTVME